MLETRLYRLERERSLIDDTSIEDWFTSRDWVAAGERFRARPDAVCQLRADIRPVTKRLVAQAGPRTASLYSPVNSTAFTHRSTLCVLQV